MVEWHHQLNGHESEQALGVGDGQGWRAAVHGVAKSRTRLNNKFRVQNTQTAWIHSIVDCVTMLCGKYLQRQTITGSL